MRLFKKTDLNKILSRNIYLVRQLWSGETREAGQVTGFPHQVPFGPAVAQQGAGVLAAGVRIL